MPARLWRLVVLILAAGMAGHVLFRLVGARWGLPLAGFLSGFASSTAAVAAGALFASVGSLALLAALLATVSPALIGRLAAPLAMAGLGLVAAAGTGAIRRAPVSDAPAAGTGRAFRLSHALMLAGLMGLLLLSSWLQGLFGSAGVVAAASAVALVEIHAAGAGLAQLVAGERLSIDAGCWGVLLLLAVSAIGKAGIAFASGGRRYGWRVTAGLTAAPILSAAVLLLINTNN